MPKQLSDFTDVRQHQWCIHCGREKAKLVLNRDHVPSRSLVDKTHHEELQVTEICKACNDSFSLDEEYLLCFLSAVLSGTTNPNSQIIKKAKAKFQENKSLRERIEKQEKHYETLNGDSKSVWEPELGRIKNVVIKNARGHFYHEMGEPMLENPSQTYIAPISSIDASTLQKFQSEPSLSKWGEVGSRWTDRVSTKLFFDKLSKSSAWGEVGSRWNRRQLTEPIFDELGYAVVQPNVYKFKVHTDIARVDTIIRDYLFTSVSWAH